MNTPIYYLNSISWELRSSGLLSSEQCAIIQKTAAISYVAAEVWNHILEFACSTVLCMSILLWAGLRSRYSDWLRAGRSGDRISVGARFSAPVQTGPEAHPASCTMSTGSFPGVNRGRVVTLTPHPLLVPWSWKSRAIPLLPPMGRTACTGLHCLYKGALYLLPYCYVNNPDIKVESELSVSWRCCVQI